ncbi:hypothetical protein NN561_008033 [Cricetulus griseus]
MLRAVTARALRLTAPERLLHLPRHSRGRRTPRPRSRGGREGRDWGRRAREGEEHRKVCPVWHDVTSGWLGRGGAWPYPGPSDAVGAELRARGGAPASADRLTFDSQIGRFGTKDELTQHKLGRPSFRGHRR